MIKNDHGKQDFYNYQAIARKQDNPIKVMHEADRRKDRLNYLLGNWLPSDKNAIILEVACGAGVLMTWMKKLGYGQISGVDISEEQTAIAKQCGLAVVTEEALAFLAKCDDDHYDAIFALDFYEHLTPDQFVQFLAVANKKLKTKGILVLRGPNGDSPMLGAAFFNDITHEFCLTTNAMSQSLRMYGFDNIEFVEESAARFQGSLFFIKPIYSFLRFFFKGVVKIISGHAIKYWDPSIFIKCEKNDENIWTSRSP